MTKKSAKIIEYKDYNENKILKCPECGWKGTAKGNIEHYSHLFDVCCPKCDKMILIVNYPTIRE